MKIFIPGFIFLGFLFFSLPTPGFSEPCSPENAFSNVLDYDRMATGQMVSRHDCNGDGQADYQSFWTVIEFSADPLACQDPYDRRHLIVPRSGYYRVLADAEQVEVLLEKTEGTPDDR